MPRTCLGESLEEFHRFLAEAATNFQAKNYRSASGTVNEFWVGIFFVISGVEEGGAVLPVGSGASASVSAEGAAEGDIHRELLGLEARESRC